jgi:hypothetical protein
MRIGGVAILALVALSSCGETPASEVPPTPPATQSTPIVQPTAGSITGTVRLMGLLKPLPSDDPCGVMIDGGKHVDRAKLRTIILGEGQTLGNVYVAVKSGLGEAVFPPDKTEVVLRLVNFVYDPRVVGLMTHQVLKARNEGDSLHNVHIRRKFGVPFNKGYLKGAEEVLRFDKPEVGIPVHCDVHPWERAWIHVSDHPYFAVTGMDGRFAIAGLPPGDYEIMAWHERFRAAPLIKKVKVEPRMTATLDFTFEVSKP